MMKKNLTPEYRAARVAISKAIRQDVRALRQTYERLRLRLDPKAARRARRRRLVNRFSLGLPPRR
jgi:hypothetical protein